MINAAKACKSKKRFDICSGRATRLCNILFITVLWSFFLFIVTLAYRIPFRIILI